MGHIQSKISYPFCQQDYNELSKQFNLADFNTISVIGRGTLGKVLLVQHIPTKQLYAMKQIRKDTVIKFHQKSHILSEKQYHLMQNTIIHQPPIHCQS